MGRQFKLANISKEARQEGSKSQVADIEQVPGCNQAVKSLFPLGGIQSQQPVSALLIPQEAHPTFDNYSKTHSYF